MVNLRNHRRWLVVACIVASATEAAAQAGTQKPPGRVRLSSVISAFLVDSGVRSRGLPWTTGSALPVKWQTSGPVTNPDVNARSKGVLLARTGTFVGTVGDSVALPMTITLTGSEVTLSGVTVSIESMEVTRRSGGGYFATREMVEKALKNEGLVFTPLKCSRDKEGASYGNLVDAVKAPGKTASGLWWFWQSPQQRMSIWLSILYRRAEMEQVECQG